MAISKDSKRIQFTLNGSKEKEREIIEFLDGCLNPNSTIKEIIFNYIVTHGDAPLSQVTHLEVTQSDTKSVEVSDLDNNIVSESDDKSVKVSELEQNELDELNKFL